MRRAFQNARDLDPSPEFITQLRTRLQDTAHQGRARRVRFQGWWALAATVLLAVAIGIAYRGRDWITANNDLAHSLASAFYQAGKWANTHKAESAVIEAGITKVDLQTVRTMQRNPLSTSLNPAYIQPLLDMAARYKVIDRPVMASEIIAPGFA